MLLRQRSMVFQIHTLVNAMEYYFFGLVAGEVHIALVMRRVWIREACVQFMKHCTFVGTERSTVLWLPVCDTSGPVRRARPANEFVRVLLQSRRRAAIPRVSCFRRRFPSRHSAA